MAQSFLLAVITVFLAVSTPAWPEGGEKTVVIGPVSVISMTSGTISPDRAVIVHEGVISQISAFDELQGGAGAEIVDGQGGFLIPGLAEMHAHIPSQSRGEQYARDILMLYLANGVTTARGMLGESWHLELRALLASGDWPGPRLITSGPSFNGRSVTSPEQAKGMVAEQAGSGYDFLKLHPGLKPAEFETIAGTARSSDIPFAGHVSFEVGLDAALKWRQATIDHLDGYAEAMVPADSPLHGQAPEWFGVNLGAEMDPALAASLARSTALAGVWNVPTQSLLENLAGNRSLESLLARPGMAYVSDELESRWSDSVAGLREAAPEEQRLLFLDARRELIRQLQDAQAGLLLGSDAPQIMNVPGFSVHEELGFLVAAGLTPLQALQSGTVNVARFFGDENSGEVQQGFRADFILLESNPLEEISATRQILGVMRAGNWYSRERLDEILDAIRNRGI